MKNLLWLLLPFFFFSCQNDSANAYDDLIIRSDIDNFWKAYDQIIALEDSLEQVEILKREFIDKASLGQQTMFQVRNYRAEEYLQAIKNYPKFWNAIRPNMERISSFSTDIGEGVATFFELYPEADPAELYFTMGVFRSPGTTLDSLILIGCELAMGDAELPIDEFPKRMQYVADYFQNDPMKDIVFLNVHEYVHTQQKTSYDVNLLAQCTREGVAEFIAELVYQKPSPSTAIIFGKENDAAIKARFAKEMFSHYYQNWLWSSFENEFKVRDLGYYIGYAIAKKYYEQATDKQAAIKTLIELDYTNNQAIEQFVEELAYFDEPIEELKTNYQANVPKVSAIKEFENGSQSVNPNITTLTIEFSQPMDTRLKNLRVGPLGEEFVLPVAGTKGFSEDGKSITYNLDMAPDKRYQLLITDVFRTVDGVLLEPYLIDIQTAKK